MKRVINSLVENINQNNINGIFSINDAKIFYKILSDKEFLMEKKGYKSIQEKYKVPKKIFELEDTTKVIGYEYYDKSDLLVSYFINNEEINEEYENLLKMFGKVFSETIDYSYSENSHLFFEDRLNNRLKNNISFSIGKYNNKIFNLNNHKICLDILQMNNEIITFFNNKKRKWNIVSQCDPNDLNICIDGTIFDYTAGGQTPLMAELAVFICYNLIQGEYLSLKYNQKAFKYYPEIYNHMSNLNIKNSNISYKVRKIRLESVLKYIDYVIVPTLEKIDYSDWYNDFKNYFVMKLLAVFDFNKMSDEDVIFSLTYAYLFYNKKFDKIDKFKEFLMEVFKC